MGLRFRKSYKIAPGVKFNVNKKSVGMTFGGKGVHYTVNSSGRKTTSVGVPGTGLYYTNVSGPNKSAPNNQQTFHQPYRSTPNLQQNIPDECPCCGAKNENHDAFCKICGQPLSDPTPAQQAYVPPVYIPPTYTQASKHTKPKKNHSALISLIIAIIVISIPVYWLFSVWNKYEAEQSAKQTADVVQEAQQPSDTPLKPPTTTTTDNSVSDAQVNNNVSNTPTNSTPSDNATDNNSVTSDENKADMVWYVDGGSRYHRKSSCSNMDNPKQITKEEAESMGLTPCKRCY